jgi:hypothetical protein
VAVAVEQEPQGFAVAVEGAPLVEARREQIREAQHWLTEWERHRRDEDRGRLLQSLDTLALLVRGTWPRSTERIADTFGGFDGGWAFWLAGLALLEQGIARSRERDGGFTSYPRGELRRFTRDLEDACNLLGAAVAMQSLLNDDDADTSNAADVAGALVERVRATVARNAA